MNKLKYAYSYSDIGLVPRITSTLEHRSESDISVNFCGLKLKIPLIASPMVDVCNGEMAYELARHGALGIIHRFQSIEEQINQYQLPEIVGDRDFTGKLFEPKKHIACAVGATGDYLERLEKLYDAGCRIFCIDTANGFNAKVKIAIKAIRDFESTRLMTTINESRIPLDNDFGTTILNNRKLYIIAGNVATKEGFKYLAELEVDAIRVGIAGGSVCITRTETGVYYPMASSVIECADAAASMRNPPILIADGGIQLPADLAKCLALGADIAMVGSIFAGTKEAPGVVIKDKEGRLYKLYRGAASFGVQKEHSGEEPAYNEGNETIVPYKTGGIEKVIDRFKAGLSSSFSYMNARTIEEFKNNVDYVII